MIIRLIAVDPRPRLGETDLRVYQVPEHSREEELLKELFTATGVEFAVIEAPARQAKRKAK